MCLRPLITRYGRTQFFFSEREPQNRIVVSDEIEHVARIDSRRQQLLFQLAYAALDAPVRHLLIDL